mmetsp:Transcript_3244/g.4724  ORF Transcript_3244/g.4724 Transcript_3244/m.4724 type:complete len:149 (-) Transcript_3244:137-583(-)
MMEGASFLLLSFLLFLVLLGQQCEAGCDASSNSECISILEDISVRTGTQQCMSCQPAKATCASGCQTQIDQMYIYCDGVELPDGFYFDPAEEINGCWEDVVDFEIKNAVERCGCDAAVSKLKGSASVRTAIYTGLAVTTFFSSIVLKG